jgi:AraC-like DNA-binding protein
VLASGPGSDVVMARLSDALVARALRFHAESEESGWLGALRDPPIARALAAMHDDLARAWTLPALAKIAGVSRSVFVDRFRSTVGETPMQHLLRRRMRRAMALLDDGVTLASAAARVGYASEPALAVAFKRHTGVTPGAYRRRAIRGAG